jgi:uncharacterized protein YndB with AHSA1/START domain
MGENGNKLTVTTPSDTEIHMTRVFDAPRDLVFEAHTSCEHMSNWWGPRQYKIADCEIDFRPGGTWRVVHQAPGEEHVFSGEYREIVRPETITWTFEWGGAPGHGSVETLTLEEQDGKTLLKARAVYQSIEDRNGMMADGGMEAGAAETFDRLDEYLEILKAGSGR